MKKMLSMAVDSTNNKIAYSVGSKAYIYKLSDVKAGSTTVSPTVISIKSNQGLEINGDYLYYVTNSGNDIGLYKYNISTGASKSIIMDLSSLYSHRSALSTGALIEAEGLSIYNGKLYLGIISKEGSIAYNDIYLVEGF